MLSLKDFKDMQIVNQNSIRGGKEIATTWKSSSGGSGKDTRHRGHDADGNWYNYTEFDNDKCWDWTTNNWC